MNPKDRAATHRLDLSLVPDAGVACESLAFIEGDAKYGGYNWRTTGVRASVYCAAARRHLGRYWNGEWADPKTRVPHLASVRACINIIIDAGISNKLVDDRPPKQDVSFYTDYEEIVKHLHELYPDGPPRHTEILLEDL